MARWTDIAQWRGPAADNFGDGDRTELEAADALSDHRGLVVHIAEGTLAGTESWEKNPASGISSHFIAGRDGTLLQMVDTHDRAWTQRAGNPYWLSVECEGFTPASAHYRPGWEWLTTQQIDAVARILVKANQVYGVPIQIATSPNGRGLGHHSMGSDWGHQDCPGNAIISQKPAIIARALAILGGNLMDWNDVIPGTGSKNTDGTTSPDRTAKALLADVFTAVTGARCTYDEATGTWSLNPGDFWPQNPAARTLTLLTELAPVIRAGGSVTLTDAQVTLLGAEVANQLAPQILAGLEQAMANVLARTTLAVGPAGV